MLFTRLLCLEVGLMCIVYFAVREPDSCTMKQWHYSRHLSWPSYLFSPSLNLQSSVIVASYSLLIYLFLPFPQTSQGTLCSGSWEEREGMRVGGARLRRRNEWKQAGGSGGKSFRMEEDRKLWFWSEKCWLVDRSVQNISWHCRLSETLQRTSLLIRVRYQKIIDSVH